MADNLFDTDPEIAKQKAKDEKRAILIARLEKAREAKLRKKQMEKEMKTEPKTEPKSEPKPKKEVKVIDDDYKPQAPPNTPNPTQNDPINILYQKLDLLNSNIAKLHEKKTPPKKMEEPKVETPKMSSSPKNDEPKYIFDKKRKRLVKV